MPLPGAVLQRRRRSPWCRKNWAMGSNARTQAVSPQSRVRRARTHGRARYRKEGSCRQSTSSTSTASTRHCGDTGGSEGAVGSAQGRPPALTAFCRSELAFLRAPGGGKGPPGLCVPRAPPGEAAARVLEAQGEAGEPTPGGTPARTRDAGRAQDSRRPLCSRRRWQYSRAFSRSHSAGGSRWLAVEAAESTDTVEPSSSDLSSEERGWLSSSRRRAVWRAGEHPQGPELSPACSHPHGTPEVQTHPDRLNR